VDSSSLIFKMHSKICKKCGKLIEGYSQRHVDYLMMQHELKHRNEELNKQEEKQNGRNSTGNRLEKGNI